MAKFEESSLFQALTAEDKTKESILSALGSAAVDLSLRSSNGQTYIHLAATHRKCYCKTELHFELSK